MSREPCLFQLGPEEPAQADHGKTQTDDDGLFWGVRGVDLGEKDAGATPAQQLTPELFPAKVCVGLPEVQDIPVGLLPEFFGRDGLTHEEFVYADAQDAAQLRDGGQVGEVGPGLPPGDGLVGYAKLFPQVLLGQAQFFPAGGQEGSGFLLVHGNTTFLFGSIIADRG